MRSLAILAPISISMLLIPGADPSLSSPNIILTGPPIESTATSTVISELNTLCLRRKHQTSSGATPTHRPTHAASERYATGSASRGAHLSTYGAIDTGEDIALIEPDVVPRDAESMGGEIGLGIEWGAMTSHVLPSLALVSQPATLIKYSSRIRARTIEASLSQLPAPSRDQMLVIKMCAALGAVGMFMLMR